VFGDFDGNPENNRHILPRIRQYQSKVYPITGHEGPKGE